jgi:methionyl-tRNA formyltransferase
MSDPSRIVFAGTPEFSVPPLRSLLENGYQVVAVYTQPDRPAGRGRKLAVSPVKQVALETGLPVLQPGSLKEREAQQRLAALAPDLMVVVAYGLLLPQRVLDTPRLGCINIHASLLPRWRGAAPIQRALLAGDTETGITIMQMEAGLDTGPMIHKCSCPISAEDTGQSLHDRLASLGAAALLESLPGILAGNPPQAPQDDADACYAKKVTKEEALLDWTLPALHLGRMVRAFNPWPVAHTRFAGVTLRVWEAEALSGAGTPGRVLGAGREGIDVGTGAGVLRIKRLQMPGKRPVNAAEFSNAHHPLGSRLG